MVFFIPFEDIIGCRDDIMVDLINYGLDDKEAFSIMEHVRKGKGLNVQEKDLLNSHDVPNWYQLSCEKIQYMFPKAHATIVMYFLIYSNFVKKKISNQLLVLKDIISMIHIIRLL